MVSVPATRRLLGSLFALGSVLVTGCALCEPVTETLDDFEQRCGDAPCGWTADEGSIESQSTFHETEHGMWIGPGTTATLGVSSRFRNTPTRVAVTARCDSEARLRLTLIGTGPLPSDGGIDLEPPSGTIDVEGAADLFEVYAVSLAWPGGTRPDLVRVQTFGIGGCVIDDVLLSSTNDFWC